MSKKKGRLTFRKKKRSYQFEDDAVEINLNSERVGTIHRRDNGEWFWYGSIGNRRINTSGLNNVARDLEGCKAEAKRFFLEGLRPGAKPQEQISPGGIVLPKMPEPEPTPEPQEEKPKRWCFTVGFYPFESSDQHAKKSLEVLYAIGLGRCGLSQELWEKRERVRELLDQLSQEMVGEVPSIEELC